MKSKLQGWTGISAETLLVILTILLLVSAVARGGEIPCSPDGDESVAPAPAGTFR